MELMSIFFVTIKYELIMAYRKRSQIIQPLLFFVIVVALFPLAISPDNAILPIIGPGIIWTAALLAILLSLQDLFRSDYEDGTLEQLLLSPNSLPLLVFAKITAHWLICGLPLILFSPLLSLLFHLPQHAIFILFASLLLGTPVLSLIGAIGTALTLSLHRSGMLLALVILPLYIPILIFGAGAVTAASGGMSSAGELALLSALLVLALTLAPFVTTASLRVMVN